MWLVSYWALYCYVLFIDLLFHLFQYRLQTLFALTLSQLHISLYYSILHHIIFFLTIQKQHETTKILNVLYKLLILQHRKQHV